MRPRIVINRHNMVKDLTKLFGGRETDSGQLLVDADTILTLPVNSESHLHHHGRHHPLIFALLLHLSPTHPLILRSLPFPPSLVCTSPASQLWRPFTVLYSDFIGADQGGLTEDLFTEFFLR